ncbi:MAG: ribosome silencing factor [Chthonomonadetes bacterium]|nr:ribosome silencing factor [Chthonomonadetes bacterium]
MTAEEKMDIILRAADEVKAEDITQIDLRGKTILADYFLLMNGRSSIQVRAIVDKIIEFMEQAGQYEVRLEGYVRGEWVLLDYGDVVVHVMQPEVREFYGLEQFWRNAPLLDKQG